MRSFRTLLTAACLTILPLAAHAHETKAGNLVIEHAWSRASSTQNGVTYMVIENNGNDADKLVSASTTAADMPMLHVNYQDGEVMKMRMVDAIDIPAHGKQELKPGSFHIMLMGLKSPLKEGQMFPMTLTFEKAGKVDVEVMVEAVGSQGPAHHEHHQ